MDVVMPPKKITKVREVGIGQNLRSHLTNCESTNEQMSTEVFLSDSDSPVSSIYGPSTIRLTHTYIITGATSNFNPNINLIERVQYLEKRLGIKGGYDLDIAGNKLTENKVRIARIKHPKKHRKKTHSKKHRKVARNIKVVKEIPEIPENSIGYLEL